MAEEGTIYGPVYLSRGEMSHHHGGTTLTFTAPVVGEGVVVIKNGGDSGKKSRVSSAKIKFNGEKIARPRKFNKKVHEIRIDVDLLADNEMKVKIKSCNRRTGHGRARCNTARQAPGQVTQELLYTPLLIIPK
jgi:hypothetical protein